MTIRALMSNEVFTKGIAKLSRTFNSAKTLCWDLAQDALCHFHEHGNTARLQQVLDVLPKNFVRRAAYEKWVFDFAPITKNEETGRFEKDRSRPDMVIDFEAAFKEPFWEYAPDPEAVAFSTGNVIVALKKTLKKFHNDKKYKAENESAMAMLAKAEALVTGLETEGVSVEAAAADDDGEEIAGVEEQQQEQPVQQAA